MAQLDNHLLEEKIDTLAEKFSIKVAGLTYIKNNEYFQPNLDGYTQIGQWLNPELGYQLHPKVNLRAGVWVQRNFGENKVFVQPTFTVSFKNKQWEYLLGNINGHLSHRLIEPMFDFERLITHRNETGLQVRKLTSRSFTDIWLDWQAFTLPGQTNQEQIVLGMSFNRQFTAMCYGISQTLVQHKGGQNLAVKLPVQTFVSQVIGIGLRQPKWRFENYVLFSTEGDKSGWAYYNTIFVNNRWFKTGLSYFYGQNFISPMGGPIFQSVSSKVGNDAFYIARPNVLMLRIMKEKRLFNVLNVSFRFEPFYDFNLKTLSHSEGLYVRF